MSNNLLNNNRIAKNKTEKSNILDIYHGSDRVVERPVHGKGKPYNDYGLGFYCTEHIELAKEWACASNNSGYANRYQLDCSELSILYLNGPEYNILNWLAILLENRKFNVAEGMPHQAKAYLLENFKVDYKDYDVIIGYRADDSYFAYAGDFINGTLSLNDLSEAMRLGKLGEQIVLKSEKAFNALTFIEAIEAPRDKFYDKYKLRDSKARDTYKQISKHAISADETYVIDIIRNNWKDGKSI